MSYKMTASTASGYMTSPMFDVSLGPFRSFVAHYSAPSAATAYVDPGMGRVVFINVQDADPTTYQFATNSAGGQTCYFSGLITGSTGYIFILGF
jgi:hypothetical protein